MEDAVSHHSLSDAELLRRYQSAGDEEAFAEIVSRHAATVLGVCQRMLGNRPDAEDAVQATFLTLSLSAGSIRSRQSLSAWLHRVALRTAVRLLRTAGRHEPEVDPVGTGDILAQVERQELLLALDEELDALPERYRAALVLCYLEDRPRAEAARQLGWTLPAVKAALARGRALLRRRLARRGFTLLATGVALAECSRSTTCSAALVEKVELARRFGTVPGRGDVSPTVQALATQGVHEMTKTSLGKLGLVAAATCLVTTALCLWLREPVAAGDAAAPASVTVDATMSRARRGQPDDVSSLLISHTDAPAAKRPPAATPGEGGLTGRWKKTSAFGQCELEFDSGVLHGDLQLSIDDVNLPVSFTAEYSIASGDLLYGVIQSVDVGTAEATDAEATEELQMLTALALEQPFAIRFYRGRDGLTVKSVKLGVGSLLSGDDEMLMMEKLMFTGRWTNANDSES